MISIFGCQHRRIYAVQIKRNSNKNRTFSFSNAINELNQITLRVNSPFFAPQNCLFASVFSRKSLFVIKIYLILSVSRFAFFLWFPSSSSYFLSLYSMTFNVSVNYFGFSIFSSYFVTFSILSQPFKSKNGISRTFVNDILKIKCVKKIK